MLFLVKGATSLSFSCEVKLDSPMASKEKKTTQDFKDEFLLQKNTYVDFNQSVIDFMMDPYRLVTPLQSLLVVVAEALVPEKDWSSFGVKPMYSWILLSLLSQNDKDYIRDYYFREVQLRDFRQEIVRKVKDVLLEMETHPYKLNNDRILTRVCGYITDIDIGYYDKYVVSTVKKVDIKDIILQLIAYTLVPSIYIDTVKVLVEEIFSEIRHEDYKHPSLILAGHSQIAADIVTIPMENIPIIHSVGEYEPALAGIVETVSADDELGRPVIVEGLYIELDAVPEYPGILTPQCREMLDEKDGVPQLSDKMKSRMLSICGKYDNYQVTLVSCVVVGNDDEYELFEERYQYSLSQYKHSPSVPFRYISDLLNSKLCDMSFKHKVRGELEAVVASYVSNYKKKLSKTTELLSEGYHENYAIGNSSDQLGGYRSKRTKFKDK